MLISAQQNLGLVNVGLYFFPYMKVKCVFPILFWYQYLHIYILPTQHERYVRYMIYLLLRNIWANLKQTFDTMYQEGSIIFNLPFWVFFGISVHIFSVSYLEQSEKAWVQDDPLKIHLIGNFSNRKWRFKNPSLNQ